MAAMSPSHSIVAMLVCAVVGAACSTADSGAPSTTIPVASTRSPISVPPETAAPTTSTQAVRVVELALHEYEQLAASGGVAIEVAIDGDVVGALDAATPSMDISLTEAVDVDFTYIDPGGEPTEVIWVQEIGVGSDRALVVQPWRDVKGTPERYVVAWQSQGTTSEYVERLDAAPSVTVTSPLWWSIDENGELRGGGDAAYVAAAHDRGGAVWPAVQGINAEGLHILLTDPVRRQTLAQQLSDAAQVLGSDGLNIDVEGFWDEDGELFSMFVEEISEAVHAWGGVVSYDLVPRSDTWEVTPVELAFWSTAPERRRLAAAVDYTVIMAYDQHNRFRPAGPVAAPGWVEELIVYALRYADPHTVLLGIPAYGRIWDPAELDAPRAVAIGSLVGREGIRSPDEDFGVDRIDLPDGRFFWAEQDIVADRLDFVDEYGLSGWAVWRLGLDDPSLWEAMER
jgi:spore germination protein